MIINELQPGRKLDALIAVAHWGWRWMEFRSPNSGNLIQGIWPPDAPKRMFPNGISKVWRPAQPGTPLASDAYDPIWWDDGEYQRGLLHYSTDIAAAWLIVQAGKVAGAWQWDDGRWYAPINRLAADEYWFGNEEPGAATAPLAICLAALRAVPGFF